MPDRSFVNTVGEIIGSHQRQRKRAAPGYHYHMHHYSHTQRVSNGAGSSAELTGSPPLSGHSPTGEQGVPGFQKKRVCFDAMNLTQAMTELPSKRLRHNRHFTLQGEQRNFGPPDPLDADPLDLMASQAHLLDTTHATRLERGNSSNYPQQLEPLPPPSIQELDVGLPETAGSNGKPDDKEKSEFHASGSQQEKEKAAERSLDNEAQAQQQLQQLKKQHRLQLQERNRQICHLQEDREKLRRSLRKAESDLREAQDAVLCTICHKNKRNCLILPCLHFLLCAGCLQQHTTTCPFCPACNTKVSGLMVLLTTV